MWLVSLFVAVVSGRVFYEEAPRPVGWSRVSVAPEPSKVLRLHIALTPRTSPATIAATLRALATPGSPRFREYLSREEVVGLVVPKDEDVARAVEWASSAGEVATYGDWMMVETTVSGAEKLLKTRFATFAKDSEHKLHAVEPYAVPDDLDDVVDFVAGIHAFFGGRGDRAVGHQATTESVTPSVLDTLYSLPEGVETNKITTQAVVQFGDNFSPDDLQTFFEDERTELEGQTVTVKVGTNNPEGVIEGEANLDTQYIMAVGQFVQTFDYALSLDSDPAGFLAWSYEVGNDTDAPLVHSISYGEYGGSYDNATVQRFSHELAKLGLRGISVMLASGDNGVGCSKRVACDFGSTPEQEFDFPSSPYLTMVGATQVSAQGTETAATLSSGGFSADYPRATEATFQIDAVAEYLAKLGDEVPTPSESFDSNGRGYPDVAATGYDLKIVVDGRLEAVDGTSCSSPIFAGIIALINAELINAGEQSLGWLQPWLYNHTDMFTDITSGSNPYGCCDGFTATDGWDPVTGLGTPIYTKMLEYALADAKNAAIIKKTYSSPL